MEILIYILLALMLAMLLSVCQLFRKVWKLQGTVSTVSAKQTECFNRLKALEEGSVPDHEKAKAAAKATNDFMAGVANIMGFDPFESLKRAKNPEGGSDE